MKTLRCYLAYSLLLLCCYKSAAEDLSIQADNFILKHKLHTAMFKGRVVINFRDFVIYTSKLKAYEYQSKDSVRLIMPYGLLGYINRDMKEHFKAGYACLDKGKNNLFLEKKVIFKKDNYILSCNNLIYKFE